LRPAAITASPAAATSASCRPTTTTAAPSRPNAVAVARPIPLVAPVTMTDLPVNDMAPSLADGSVGRPWDVQETSGLRTAVPRGRQPGARRPGPRREVCVQNGRKPVDAPGRRPSLRGKAFASSPVGLVSATPDGRHFMQLRASQDVYSPDEIARAAGVADTDAIAAIGDADALLPFADAVRVGRALARGSRGALAVRPRLLFTGVSPAGRARSRGVPLLLSSPLPLTAVAVSVFIATLGLAPTAATLHPEEKPADPMRLVFLATPGPGGGGGGGGLLQ